MVLPKRWRVKACERRDNGSSNSLAAGEIKCAKSFKERALRPRLSRAAVRLAVRERSVNEAKGNLLNLATNPIGSRFPPQPVPDLGCPRMPRIVLQDSQIMLTGQFG